ncbi:MAG: helix-turn-helix domain-containing protein [Vampirovibrionales bacterium]
MMKYPTAPLIHHLIKARHEKGLSQTALGKKLGIPQSHVSNMESGNVEPRLSTFIEWARILDVEIALVHKTMLPVVYSLCHANAEELSIPKQILREAQEAEARERLWASRKHKSL